MKKRREERIIIPDSVVTNQGSFRGLKFLGSVVIKKSIAHLDSGSRSQILAAGIRKVLSRYGRTNYHHSADDRFEASFVGLSPMSVYNNQLCIIKIQDNAILVEVEQNGITETLFNHAIQTISVATVDRNLPTIYSYVANTPGGQRESRKLYVFECPDILSTKKVIDATHARFKRQPTCPTTQTSHPGVQVRRRPPPPPLPDQANDDNTYLITRS